MQNILYSKKTKAISGEIIVSADKSISHRAVILSAMATGVSYIENLLIAQDVIDNMEAFKKLGVKFVLKDNIRNIYEIHSKGFKEFKIVNQEDNVFYFGNSGTACRLFIGILSGIEGKFILKGDNSLQKRPMARVINPLTLMGAEITAKENNFLPIAITGQQLKGINYKIPEVSAQVKTAILLAGLQGSGEMIIEERVKTRDHLERMLQAIGVNIIVEDNVDKTVITLNNQQQAINNYKYVIPQDFSSAAFFIVMALICEDSEVILKDINLNPLRSGLLSVLKEMGANIEIMPKDDTIMGEVVGDIKVKFSKLKGIKVNPKIVSNMIDEFPILSIAAVFAEGESVFTNIKELRIKESDRIKSMVVNLIKLGVKVEENEDSLKIYGGHSKLEGGAVIDSFNDHRIAMSFLIMGLKCEKPLVVEGCNSINTSFPTFYEICQKLKLNVGIK